MVSFYSTLSVQLGEDRYLASYDNKGAMPRSEGGENTGIAKNSG